MARKTAPPAPELPLYLAVSREDAAQGIADRIKRGTELKTRPIQTKQVLDQVQRDYWRRSEYEEEMLRRMFTTPKIADATEPVRNGYLLTVACPCGVVFGRWVTPEDAELDLLRAAGLN